MLMLKSNLFSVVEFFHSIYTTASNLFPHKSVLRLSGLSVLRAKEPKTETFFG
jgi:hypothetical protein